MFFADLKKQTNIKSKMPQDRLVTFGQTVAVEFVKAKKKLKM